MQTAVRNLRCEANEGVKLTPSHTMQDINQSAEGAGGLGIIRGNEVGVPAFAAMYGPHSLVRFGD